ncbi:MAG TPA: DUF3606 domain-containing protein [Burkholderiales bacterium]|jgi:hypothetical protein|nr:DUF3606 domain-containing protein [Burkholderiales bacterium]
MYQEPPVNEEADAARIDTGMEFEVTYWSRQFGVTKAALRQTIAKVGNRAQDVRRALARRRQRLAA